MAFGSCRFLFCQFIQRNKAHKVIADVDTLYPVSAALVRGFHIDCGYQFPQGVGGNPVQICVLLRHLDKLLNVFCLSFLYFNFFPQTHRFRFQACLLVLIGLAHHGKPFIGKPPAGVVLVNLDIQTVKLRDALLRLG